MKHRLRFVRTEGLLAEALGLDMVKAREIEKIVEEHIAANKNMRDLFAAVGELEISDEMWANFLYTFGYWDGRKSA